MLETILLPNRLFNAPAVNALQKMNPVAVETIGPHAQTMTSVPAGSSGTYQFLPYYQGSMTETLLVNDVVTGPFGGCLLVAYRRPPSNQIYIGHIGTGPGKFDAASKASKQAWRDFVATIGDDDLLAAYNPFSEWIKKFGEPKQQPPQSSPDKWNQDFWFPLYAVITAGAVHQCHMFTFFQQKANANHRRVGQIARIQPFANGAAMRTLFPAPAVTALITH